jgi:isopentenyl-diphosphate delta-isomerase
MDIQQVILVDTNDREIGVDEKISAHKKGVLHRAFSIFIVNDRNEMLLHRRALDKYHSAGLWTNACCSHPMPSESLEQAVVRRLKEEMGFYCPVRKIFHFIYKEQLDSTLVEHEFDHVYLGIYTSPYIEVNVNEVAAYGYFPIKAIDAWIKKAPHEFTCWFKIAYPKVCEYMATQGIRE